MTDRWARGILFFILLALYLLTWEKWGSPVVDCGREMLIPAMLSQGKRLYFDVWYVYGPLIPYWHSLLFRVFGIHLTVLYLAGLCIVISITGLLYSISRVFLPVWLSFAAVFAFLLQAFQLTIFNFILPYSYPAAYGALFSVLLLWLLIRDCFDPKLWHILVGGLIAGLMALNKIEFAAVAYGGLLWAIAVRAARSRSAVSLAKDLLALLPGFALFIPVYWWLLSHSSVDFLFGQNMSFWPGSWFVTKFAKKWSEGLGFSTSPIVLLKSISIGLSGAATILVALYWAQKWRIARLVLVLVVLLLAGIQVYVSVMEKIFHRTLPGFIEALPPFVFFNPGMIWLSVVLLLIALRNWWSGKRGPEDSALLLLPVFAIGCGFRVFAYITPYYYAVFLDMLAYLAWIVAIYYLARLLPLQLSDRVWQIASAVFCFGMILVTAEHYPVMRRPVLISSPRGDMHATKSIGGPFAEVLEFLNAATARSERFVAIPEETSFYYFTGTMPPSRWFLQIPPVLPEGEHTRKFIEELDRQQLDYVVLSDRATPEYGLPIFGIDYAQDIYRWIEDNYTPIETFGDYKRIPLPPAWSARIYKRRLPRTIPRSN